MPPSVSIVTPSFNQARFIERTIASVLEQAYPSLEYVICDGNSTDGTRMILDRYRSRAVIVSEPDDGQASAVNKAIRLTCGEIIGWLNSDDVYRPDAIARVAAVFAHGPDIDVVYGEADLIDADDRVIGRYYTEPWDASRLPQRCFLCQPAVFFRRRAIERWGSLDERLHFCLDYEYWLRLCAGGAHFEYIPDVLAASRLHAQTKTLGQRLEFHRELNGMLRDRLGQVPDPWLLNQAHTIVELDRARRPGRRMPYALEVVVRTLQLSWAWNRRVPPHLVGAAVGPALEGGIRRLRRTSFGNSCSGRSTAILGGERLEEVDRAECR
jgi:glycosyltransferase involved in cell wall biosynthesis